MKKETQWVRFLVVANERKFFETLHRKTNRHSNSLLDWLFSLFKFFYLV